MATQQNAEAARKEIRQCWNGYVASILDSDGDAAADHVTQSTLEEYAKFFQLALNAKKEELENRRLIDVCTVVLLRARFTPEEISMFSDDGEAGFAASVRSGMIAAGNVASLALGEIQIQHTAANGVVVNDGIPTELRYEFRLEEGRWKWNLIPTLVIGNMAWNKYGRMLDFLPTSS